MGQAYSFLHIFVQLADTYKDVEEVLLKVIGVTYEKMYRKKRLDW